MRLYRLENRVLLERDGAFLMLDEGWDALINRDDLAGHLRQATGPPAGVNGRPLAPICSQEVWAAGVTYYRSRTARIEESKPSGGGSFYDAVYSAERPELFFKAAGWRVRGPGEPVCIRGDARWSVPEPELALVVNRRGGIVGYTIGNDMSSRDIEGENPLYLPQAKVYDGSCALGPGVLIHEERLPPETTIALTIARNGAPVFQGSTSLAQMRRTPEELVQYLYRETSFPHGAVLLTGTGVVPPDDFTLQAGDAIAITIPPIGTLDNVVGAR
ncbi:MAG TPA: fumarylacetoacetate hydrolase family protein [Vicinamibacterales bacterium]|jgi:2-dehydro-3-deoxy-D-arabinonate dehydratase|nr:fumarylacetoacetate hydrolase family protein [Vicinamibacterales bacterium]